MDVGQVTERKGNEKISREIDFVVNDGDRRMYIQSAWQMNTEQKENAELKSLLFTGDYFKKIVIRMDIPHNYYDDNGFFHCNLMDFLLGEVQLQHVLSESSCLMISKERMEFYDDCMAIENSCSRSQFVRPYHKIDNFSHNVILDLYKARCRMFSIFFRSASDHFAADVICVLQRNIHQKALVISSLRCYT